MGRATGISGEDISRAYANRAEGETIDDIAQRLGENPNTARRKKAQYERARESGNPRATGQRVRFEEKGEGAEATSESRRIRTLAQLLKACDVDLSVWEVDRYVVNVWEVGAKQPDGSVLVEPLFQVKAWLKRKQSAQAVDVLTDLLAQIRAAAPVVRKPKALTWGRGSYLFVPGIVDTHFGRRSVDGLWTLARAAADFRATVDALLARTLALGFDIDHILFPVGNDALHVDTLAGTTTKGTPVETSADPREAARVARDAYIYAIERFAEVAPVDVVVVPGNHDALSGFSLGLAVEARFWNDKRVKFNLKTDSRKYHRYGATLIGMSHGDIPKAAALPTLMATEAKPDWSACTHYEWLLGHFHRAMSLYQPITSDKGVTMRVLPALCPPDKWHDEHGFFAPRAAEALLYHREHGPAGTFPVFVDEIAAPDHTQTKRRTPPEHGGERGGGGGEG